MPRLFAALAVAVLLCVGISVSRSETVVPRPVVSILTPPVVVTSTTVDWRPWARAVHARDVERARVIAAIEYSIAFAHQAEQARRLVTHHHVGTVPISTGTYTGWACPSLAGAFTAIWGTRAHWADRTARSESGCSTTARNPRPCDPAGRLHAIGIMQQCGYSGPLDVWSELRAAWSLCLVQRGAWSWHGSCR